MIRPPLSRFPLLLDPLDPLEREEPESLERVLDPESRDRPESLDRVLDPELRERPESLDRVLDSRVVLPLSCSRVLLLPLSPPRG